MPVMHLPGAWNFRDVADCAAALCPGRLFRSSELSRLNDDGRDALRRLGITDVADLRSPREVARRGPGQVPEGVNIHLLPFPGHADKQAGTGNEAPHESALRRLLTNGSVCGSAEPIKQAAVRYKIDEYRELPTRSGAQRALRRVFNLLAAGRLVLTHCFAGKDRTGFIVAMVLEAVGLDRDVILADYLRSNDALAQLRCQVSAMIAPSSDVELTPEAVTFANARLSDEVLGVRAEYLAAAWQTIDETFGSLGDYLRAADITAADLAKLRAALLTPSAN